MITALLVKVASILICQYVTMMSSAPLPEMRVLVLSSQTGSSQAAALPLDTLFFTKTWRTHLSERLKTVNGWPFNATVEFLDMQSNATYMTLAMAKRIEDTSLPPITVISGPENRVFQNIVAAFCAARGIPFVSPGNPQASYPRLTSYKTSFFIQPQYVYQHIQLVNAYVDQGVKSIVTVFMMTAPGNIAAPPNYETCQLSGRYAQTRGINLIKEIPMYFTYSTDDIAAIIRTIRDEFKPDGILWCDIYSSVAGLTDKYNPMPLFKKENYLPKVLSLLDNLDVTALNYLKSQELFMYVTGGTFLCNKIYGESYTEGEHDYSSMFRPAGTIANVYDELNFGSTSTSPSSSVLFYKWYQSVRNKYPARLGIALWATFDVIEAAMYRAAINPAYIADGQITPIELLNALKFMQLTTPHGPIKFNDFGENVAYNSVFVQALSITDTADVVYPASARTATMVYPMPTWDERVYTWKLIDDENVKIGIIVASVCSLLIAAIAVTVVIYRREQEIRMLSYFHIILLCLAGLLVIWSFVFLWQKDNRPLQCQSFMWTVFLPASFMVHLVNIKAYRLSLFLVATATGLRPKPFSHLKTLRLTIALVIASSLFLAIIEIVDPPKRTKYVTDPYRPKLDEYRCVIGNNGTILLYIFVIAHLLFSGFCVAAVRNGMEDFRDGMIIKESFMVLYICVAIAFIMSQLSLTSSTAYLLRTVILTLGVTLFIFRFLASRVLNYWIPEVLRTRFTQWHEAYLKPVISSLNISSGSHVSKSLMLSNIVNDDDKVVDFDAPVYLKDVPKDDSLQEMIGVLRDPKRSKIFAEVSKQALTTENIDFLCKVMNFEEKCAKVLSTHSANASDEMREEAVKIFSVHVAANSPDEVNVSSACRLQVDKKLTDWQKHSSLISYEDAERLLDADFRKRSKVFQTAFREISIMTYQNLWNKFRVAETTYLAMSQDETAIETL